MHIFLQQTIIPTNHIHRTHHIPPIIHTIQVATKGLMMNEENHKKLSNWDEVLNTSIYSLNAIKKVCYQFSSNFSVKLEKLDLENVKITFSLTEPIDGKQKEKIVNAFHQALLDQDLRETVFNETEGIRNLILAHAFSKTTLIKSD